ncbi:MAG: MIP family channel protein [Candidatus Promineifilaceae bacterium]|nr:MIP family channel protein [Candidatus Promineifilaceae bacterium]
MNKDNTFGEFMAEILGTFVLILLGDGVVAHVGLAPRLASAAYDWNTIAFGWGFAVAMAVYVGGGVSGAHINPAVTFALAVTRDFPWKKVPWYFAGQMIGAFLGALGVFLVYWQGLAAADWPNVWATGPGSMFEVAFWGGTQDVAGTPYPLWNAVLAEVIGTAMLMLGIVAIVDEDNLSPGANVGPLIIGFLVLSIGLSLGGPSGYAINPARDLGPRIFGAIVGTPDLFDGLYWLVAPVIAPLVGGVLGVILYDIFVSKYLPKEEPVGRTTED